MKRYILNVLAQTAHDHTQLTESCNTDDIVRRRNADTVPLSYHLCEHCFTGQPVVYRSLRTPKVHP